MFYTGYEVKTVEKTLTERQQQVYDFIVDYTVKHMYPPTIREICKSTGIRSTGTAYLMLDSIASKGYITCKRDTPRGIRLNGYEIVKKA